MGGFALLLVAGCGLFSGKYGSTPKYHHPLTVQLREAPTVANAQITYQDACGQAQALSMAKPLQEALQHKSSRVFDKVVSGAGPVDGYLDVGVGLTNLDLVIPRKGDRSYPAKVAVGLDFAYTGADGTVLYTKKLQSFASGDVRTSGDSCQVTGLEPIVEEAVGYATDGLAKQLGTSTKIIDAAAARKAGTAPAAAAVPPPSPLASARPSSPSAATDTLMVGPAPTPKTAEPAALVFRAIIRDQNRNQLLHPGETISVEVEVKNEGPGDAANVEIVATGTPELVEQIPGLLPVGDIPAGEVKRVSLEGKIGAVKEPVQAELTLALRSGSQAQLPPPKRFIVAMKPGNDPDAASVPVDVDDMPKFGGKLKQPKAVGIAIGIGRFREEGLARVKYAARDAESMAAYWQAIAGVPVTRIKRLIDAGALKHDLAETFEEWLPKLVDQTTVLYVYASGRGLVDSTTGAVSLLPFDGNAGGSSRLYSLRRLQDALSKLPIQRAIIILDLSLDRTELKEGAEPVPPFWEQDGLSKDKVMWMVGNRGVQDAHPYDLGQHGLFTYELLKGWGGAADIDKDGTILAGELCTYTRGRVSKVAREQFGNEQEPLCVPGPGQGAMVRLQPVAKLK